MMNNTESPTHTSPITELSDSKSPSSKPAEDDDDKIQTAFGLLSVDPEPAQTEASVPPEDQPEIAAPPPTTKPSPRQPQFVGLEQISSSPMLLFPALTNPFRRTEDFFSQLNPSSILTEYEAKQLLTTDKSIGEILNIPKEGAPFTRIAKKQDSTRPADTTTMSCLRRACYEYEPAP